MSRNVAADFLAYSASINTRANGHDSSAEFVPQHCRWRGRKQALSDVNICPADSDRINFYDYVIGAR